MPVARNPVRRRGAVRARGGVGPRRQRLAARPDLHEREVHARGEVQLAARGDVQVRADESRAAAALHLEGARRAHVQALEAGEGRALREAHGAVRHGDAAARGGDGLGEGEHVVVAARLLCARQERDAGRVVQLAREPLFGELRRAGEAQVVETAVGGVA